MDLVFAIFIFLIFFKCKLNLHDFNDCLSIQNTHHVRGIAVLIVIFSHLAPHADSFSLFHYIFMPIGFMAVTLFFFFSGYGLMKSYIAKDHYADTFVKKRILPILFSYLVISLIYWAGWYILGEPYTVVQVVQSFFNGFPIVTDSWYVITLLFYYTFFFLTIKIFDKKYWLIFLSCVAYVIGWMLICAGVGLGQYWYNTLFCQCIGMLVALMGDKFIQKLKQRYILFSICIIPAFLLLFLIFIRRIPLPTVGMYVMQVLFIFFVLLVTMKLQINNPFLKLLSDISLEYYLIHRLIMHMLRSSFIYIENYTVWCIAVIVLSFGCALGLHWILKGTSKNKRSTLAQDVVNADS